MLQPIPGDKPGGENAQYDARHEALRAEVAKLESMTGGEVDWPMVISTSRSLLTETTKDLLVASFFAYGSMQTDGLNGLATGFELMRGLLADFWEPMFPPLKRMRARTNAMDWLISRLENALTRLPLSPADRPALDATTEAFKALSSVAREKMGDATPGLTPVSQMLQRMDMKIPKAEAAPPAPPAEASPAAAPPQPPAASPPAEGGAPPQPPSPPAADAAPQPPAADAPPQAPAAATPPAAPAKEPEAAPDAKAREAAAAWLAPISDDAPTGVDSRYEPEYEAMRAEVAKLESAAGEEVDWLAVSENASTVLKSKSKDALAVAYLAFSKWEAGGLDGLAVGLAVVIGLFEKFPTGRWPKREKGQGAAIGWLTAQLERVLEPYKATQKDRLPLKTAEILLKAVTATIREALEDHAPSFRPLQERVQRLLMSVPEPKKEAPPPPKPPPTPTPQAAPTPAAPRPAAASPGAMPPSADVGSAEEVTKFLQETGRSMIKAAGLLRNAQISSPSAYRLLRTGLYLHLDAPPPGDAGGKTKVPPLPANRRQQFELIANSGKWAALIEETESALMMFRFSLDLHRLTGQALEGLGHKDAIAAMAGELGSVLRRMPTWPDLSAGDGSPFADDATRDWIAKTVATSPGAGGDGGGAGADDGADPAEMAKARALLGAGKAADALKLAQASVEAATQPRHRFTRRLDLAEMCLSGKQPRLARGIFESLRNEIDALGIAEWEPKMAARCFAGLVRAIRASTKPNTPPDPAANAPFEQLCRLDPSAAARLALPV